MENLILLPGGKSWPQNTLKSHDLTQLPKTESLAFKRSLVLESYPPSECSPQTQMTSADKKKGECEICTRLSAVWHWRRAHGGTSGVSCQTCLICADGAASPLCGQQWMESSQSGAESNHLGANAAFLSNNRLCPTWSCADGGGSAPCETPVWSLAWRELCFSVLLPKPRHGCYSAHVLLATASADPEKPNRYFTDVWLIGKSVSKHFRSDLTTKQAAMRGFSWGRWQIESTLKMAPNEISSFWKGLHTEFGCQRIWAW